MGTDTGEVARLKIFSLILKNVFSRFTPRTQNGAYTAPR